MYSENLNLFRHLQLSLIVPVIARRDTLTWELCQHSQSNSLTTWPVESHGEGFLIVTFVDKWQGSGVYFYLHLKDPFGRLLWQYSGIRAKFVLWRFPIFDRHSHDGE